MTSLLIKIKDDSKADDVVRFLRDIPFLEIEQLKPKNVRYDFSDLFGKLKWQGNAVKVQQEIRNEWK